MAFIDEVKLYITAGRGGDGVVRWLHEKGKEYGGPSGGDGGKGGDVYATVLRDIGILTRYRSIKELRAHRGGDGMKNKMHGKAGEDLILEFPIGSLISNLNTGKKYDLLKEGDRVLLLKGGAGGMGNEHFKASTNIRPKQFTEGKEGENADFLVELQLIADAGLVGLPNAGKSSLLNALTNATAKVGSYQFTTLEPNLGDLYGFILADIPGLIEGASEGRGLGHKFLKHIRRTSTLLHCISLENEDISKVYQTIRDELSKFDLELSKKKEIIILTKTDLIDEKTLAKRIDEAEKLNPSVLSVSIYDDASLKNLTDELTKILKTTK